MKEKTAFLSFLGGAASGFIGIVLMFQSFPYSAMDFYLVLISIAAGLVGLIFGIIGLKSERKSLAKIGLLLCIFGLFCTIIFGSISTTP